MWKAKIILLNCKLCAYSSLFYFIIFVIRISTYLLYLTNKRLTVSKYIMYVIWKKLLSLVFFLSLEQLKQISAVILQNVSRYTFK